MKIEAIKNINITISFSSSLNHLLISQKDLLELFKTGDPQKDLHTFIEAPGLKVLIFPNRQKDIVFEANRVLVNEKTGVRPEESKIIDNFQKLIEKNIIERDKIIAYGFNYDVLVFPESEDFDINNFVGSKISAIGENIKSAGVNLAFDKNNIKYILEIKPLGNGKQKFLVHLNAHFGKELPSFEELKKEVVIQFKELEEIIKKI